MTFDDSLLELYEDEITVEPFSAETAARVRTYGTSVTYPACIESGSKRVIGNDGSEVVSTVQVLIPNRVQIDQRSRVTLPTDYVPRQPPILAISHWKFGGMDSTKLSL